MYCTNCGSKLNEGAKFCVECGHATGAAAAVTSESREPQGNWNLGRLVSGRLGRMRYFTGSLLASLPFFVGVSAWGFVNIVSSSLGSVPSTGTQLFNNIIIPLFFAVSFIFFLVAHISVAVRRCHDIGYTGWISLCTYIPYIGFIFALIFLFKEGDKGANKYGNPPVSGRKFLADVFNY